MFDFLAAVDGSFAHQYSADCGLNFRNFKPSKSIGSRRLVPTAANSNPLVGGLIASRSTNASDRLGSVLVECFGSCGLLFNRFDFFNGVRLGYFPSDKRQIGAMHLTRGS
ncbi:MAG: hypothetical protein ABL901_20915, partial [Hyphomicrobiaceae bacterium]